MIVAKDGSGDFTSLQDAIDAVPEDNHERVKIYVKNGIYRQKVRINKKMISLIGEDRDRTIITYDEGAYELLDNGEARGTFRTFSFFIGGDDFYAENLTFENAAGEGDIVGQAVAVHINADRVSFKNCSFLAHQDTLFTGPYPREKQFEIQPDYIQTDPTRQYFEDCYIRGDIDFIFGSGTAVFRYCEIHSNDRGKAINGYITAPSTPENVAHGLVFIDCRLTSDAAGGTVYLGRPWRDHGKAAFINCWMGAHIHPKGWHNWDQPHREKTCLFVEYNSRGPGANLQERVAWAKTLSEEELPVYSPENILAHSDSWAGRPRG